MKIALIDGDIINYQIAANAENTYYLINDIVRVKYKKEVEQFAYEHGIRHEDLRVEKCSDPADDGNILEDISNRVSNIVEEAGCSNFRMYLSGRNSFRKRLYEAYKANRENLQKPSKFNFVRDSLIHHYNAITVDDIEADDALGITHCARQDTTVICTIDKDLMMIPGHHYNWNKKEVFDVYPHEAGYNFFIQLLTGDSSDNICGIKGVGKRTAERMLQGIEDADDCIRVVEKQYAKNFDCSLREVEEIINLNATLLWIKRHKDSVWEEVLKSF